MPLATMRKAHFAMQDLVFAHDAETAAMRSSAAGIAPQHGTVDADRGIQLERFDGQVHAIGRVGLDDIDAVLAAAGASAARDQFAGHVARSVRPRAAERYPEQR